MSEMYHGPTLRNDYRNDYNNQRSARANYREFMDRMQRRSSNEILGNQDARSREYRDLDSRLQDYLPDPRVMPDPLRDIINDLDKNESLSCGPEYRS
ncbi:MAG: hypothetical protein OEY89_11690 [Gammaproteobacteria bacterium]|nr:hypothetical protein [Gammaproteobacteria bacterium]